MRIKNVKDVSDLRDMSTSDVVDLLDELRAIATKRGTELLAQGRAGARKALGAPDEGGVGWAFLVGVLLGAAVGALVALLATPTTGPETRRRLTEEVDRARERIPEIRPDGNGRSVYERTGYEGASEQPAASGLAGMVS
jgi:YtxH-like protein